MLELKDTVTGMTSDDYKERFKAEYQQLKIRCDRLKHFVNQIEVAQILGKEEPEHDCPIDVLRDQLAYMGLYQTLLEKRAIIEEIELN